MNTKPSSKKLVGLLDEVAEKLQNGPCTIKSDDLTERHGKGTGTMKWMVKVGILDFLGEEAKKIKKYALTSLGRRVIAAGLDWDSMPLTRVTMQTLLALAPEPVEKGTDKNARDLLAYITNELNTYGVFTYIHTRLPRHYTVDFVRTFLFRLIGMKVLQYPDERANDVLQFTSGEFAPYIHLLPLDKYNIDEHNPNVVKGFLTVMAYM